jgi:hypothetical protein
VLYPSLKYMAVRYFTPGKVHHSLECVRNNTRSTYRYMIKARLQTGTYRLQTNRKAFNHTQVKNECLLCKTEPETRLHMLVKCPRLENHRIRLFESAPMILPTDPEYIAQLLLDPTHNSVSHLICSQQLAEELEHWGRRTCYTLHAERCRIMATLPSRTKYGL